LLIVQEAVAAAKQLTTETGTSWYVVKPKFMPVDVERWWSETCKNTTSRRDFRANHRNAMITPQTSAEGKKSTQSFNC
jgi:succinyl-CoA synthetase beta subunit